MNAPLTINVTSAKKYRPEDSKCNQFNSIFLAITIQAIISTFVAKPAIEIANVTVFYSPVTFT